MTKGTEQAMDNIQAARTDYVLKTKQFVVKSIHFLITITLFFFMFLLFRYSTLIAGVIDC